MAAKRKFRPLQPTTLHRFFPGPGQAKKAGSQAVSKEKQRTFLSEEVIVINSDDDDDDELVDERDDIRSPNAALKRRRSSSTSDIEIVNVSVKHLSSANGITRQLVQNASKGVLIESGTIPHQGDTFSTESDDALFGRPASLLLPSPDPCTASLATEYSSSVSLNTLQAITAVQEQAPQIPTANIESLPTDDDWNMGDDEQLLAETTRDDDDPIGETEAAESLDVDNQLSTCPVCDMSFGNMSPLNMQDHINLCLDASSVPSLNLEAPPPNPSSSNAFHPISPLQPEISSDCLTSQSRSCSSVGGSKANGNAFNFLMSSNKETEAWKEASAVEDRNFRPTKNNGGRRMAPFYKILQGMPIAVDAFRYGTIPGVTAYFLTHAHSDHYTNLSANWKSGPIYCSHATAKLIIHMLSVDPKWVHPLPLDVPFVIPNTGEVRVTLIEANHCPGSCLFLFEGLQTVNAGDSAFKSAFVGSSRVFRYLHCGDFRASPQHVLHPAVKGKRIDTVYLDTTYLDPKYAFPPQPLVISACAELAKRLVGGQILGGLSDGTNPQIMDGWMTRDKPLVKDVVKSPERMLVIVGTYSIGKERIVKAIAHALQTKVYCDTRKAAILHCQDDPELHALLTSDPHAADVHLVPLGIIVSDKLKEYLERFKGTFSKVVGFRPTGWTYSPPAGSDTSPSIVSVISRSQQRTFTYAHLRPARNSTPSLQVFGVPYSEHSSFFELTCFALSFDWARMIATVNVGSETSRGKMAKWVEKWEAERKKRGKDAVVQYREPDYW